MKKLELKDCIPSKPIFKLQKKPGVEFSLRAPNMADYAWFGEQYQSLQKMQALIEDRNWTEICRIVYYLMDEKGRAAFPAKTRTATNGDGFKEKKTYLGYQELLRHITGIEEAMGMLAALSRAIMNASPIIEKVVTDEVEKKLKAQAASTGQK